MNVEPKVKAKFKLWHEFKEKNKSQVMKKNEEYCREEKPKASNWKLSRVKDLKKPSKSQSLKDVQMRKFDGWLFYAIKSRFWERCQKTWQKKAILRVFNANRNETKTCRGTKKSVKPLSSGIQ